jgi:hypothetical protein
LPPKVKTPFYLAQYGPFSQKLKAINKVDHALQSLEQQAGPDDQVIITSGKKTEGESGALTDAGKTI